MTPLFTRFYPSQVVQDFFHQQYLQPQFPSMFLLHFSFLLLPFCWRSIFSPWYVSKSLRCSSDEATKAFYVTPPRMPVTNEGLGSGFPNLKKGKTLVVTVILGGGVDPICIVILGKTNEILQDFLKSVPSQL